MAEHPRAARVDRDARRCDGAAAGERRVDRVAGGGNERELTHLLELAPILVGARAQILLHRVRLAAGEREHAAGEVRERVQVAAGFQLTPRQQRREMHRLGALGGCGGADQGVDAGADPFERSAAPVDAGDAAVDEQAAREKLVAERDLIRAGPEQLAGHQISFASSSSPASVASSRSLVTMIGADRMSRRWRPTLYGVSLR